MNDTERRDVQELISAEKKLAELLFDYSRKMSEPQLRTDIQSLSASAENHVNKLSALLDNNKSKAGGN